MIVAWGVEELLGGGGRRIEEERRGEEARAVATPERAVAPLEVEDEGLWDVNGRRGGVREDATVDIARDESRLV